MIHRSLPFARINSFASKLDSAKESQVAREAEETAREMKGVKGSKSEGEREELLGSSLVSRAKANASYGTAKSSEPRLRLKRFMRRTVKEFAISRPYTRRA